MELIHSKCKLKTVCVLSGCSMGRGIGFGDAATEVGKALATRGIKLVYEGGSRGLQAFVAASTLVGGSQVLGIIPKFIAERNITGVTLGKEMRVESVHCKIGNMIIHADAFIVLPGGLETLETLFSVTSWASMNIHQKPVGLLNVNGFFDGLMSFIDYAVEQKFMTPANRRLFSSALTVDQLLNKLEERMPGSIIIQSDSDSNPNSDNEKKRKRETNLNLTL